MRPCVCDNCLTGQPYDDSQCMMCWLFHNNPDYRAAWDKREPPGFIERALNYAKALRDHVRAGLPMVDESTHRARLEVCEGCPLRAPDWTCNLCGCPTKDKAMWGEQACPACKKCGRPATEHRAAECDGFEPKWAAVEVKGAAPARRGCCGG